MNVILGYSRFEMTTEGKGRGFVTRSIPQRGISLPFGIRSPLKRDHARSALIVDASSHALPLKMAFKI
jgi:hypothetical protein